MRWGVRDESTDDHSTLELCLKELKACQELSAGPNFMVRKISELARCILARQAGYYCEITSDCLVTFAFLFRRPFWAKNMVSALFLPR